MSEPYVFEKDTRTVGFTSAEFGNAWAVSRGREFNTNMLSPFQEEWRSWLAAHDAKVRADQIEKDAATLERVLVTENLDEWSKGVEWARFHGVVAIRAQLTGPTS